jgi:hypothetical protein
MSAKLACGQILKRTQEMAVQTVAGEQTMCCVLIVLSGDNAVLSKAFQLFQDEKSFSF